ncbi:MAG TPA: hypothetical protein DEA08_15840, partial [Planctomycetes bacterium]|nr:hypothetical protein [Planctomycetota bacterium]
LRELFAREGYAFGALERSAALRALPGRAELVRRARARARESLEVLVDPPAGEPAGTLIWLHGAFDRPEPHQTWLRRDLPGAARFKLVLPRGALRKAFEGLEAGLPAAELALDLLSEGQPGPVYLGGVSLGAEAAYAVAIRRPERFAGVLSLEGSYSPDLGRLARARGALRVALLHGRSSWSADDARAALRRLERAGVPARLGWYTGGHHVRASAVREELRAAWGWLRAGP